jgi:hypothetical protein
MLEYILIIYKFYIKFNERTPFFDDINAISSINIVVVRKNIINLILFEIDKPTLYNLTFL